MERCICDHPIEQHHNDAHECEGVVEGPYGADEPCACSLYEPEGDMDDGEPEGDDA